MEIMELVKLFAMAAGYSVALALIFGIGFGVMIGALTLLIKFADSLPQRWQLVLCAVCAFVMAASALWMAGAVKFVINAITGAAQ